MEYVIKNQALQVKISDFGAELCSITGKDGTEYLWQGNPAVWKDRAPNIFPYVARLTEGKYKINGKIHEMKIHGIVKYETLSPEIIKEDQITFKLESTEELKKQYPFDFIYRITYVLDGTSLKVVLSVENTGKERMYFGIGGHPGFCVPLEEGLAFEDYYLEFGKKAEPYRVGFTDACFLTGCDSPYTLEEGRILRLEHSLFDEDAIVLKHMDRKVTIKSKKGKKSVTVDCQDFPYLGIWHKPKTEAPYVCIEPWSSLPSRDGIVEEFSQQSDLIGLGAGKEYKAEWIVTVSQGV